MTPLEQRIQYKLTKVIVNFRDVKSKDLHAIKFLLSQKPGKPMTEKGRDFMSRLLQRYAKYIPEWLDLRTQLTEEQISKL